jgi:hypothetical protein
MQASSKLRRRNRCPPHTPLIVQSTGDGHYVAQCLTCGLAGPERKSTSKAWQAFDELSEHLFHRV